MAVIEARDHFFHTMAQRGKKQRAMVDRQVIDEKKTREYNSQEIVILSMNAKPRETFNEFILSVIDLCFAKIR